MKFEFSRQIFEKSWNIKFHENPLWEPSCSMRTDVTKLTVASCYLANAPKTYLLHFCCHTIEITDVLFRVRIECGLEISSIPQGTPCNCLRYPNCRTITKFTQHHVVVWCSFYPCYEICVHGGVGSSVAVCMWGWTKWLCAEGSAE
jgi:hypothetical protein